MATTPATENSSYGEPDAAFYNPRDNRRSRHVFAPPPPARRRRSMPGHDPVDALCPLGTPPRLVRPLPDDMHALTIRRDKYGPPAEAVRFETAPAPRLRPVDAKRVLVAI